jgi:hypothetical protein
VSQAWKRKYIDLPTELCERLAVTCATLGISQRKYIEDSIAARISQDADNAARTKLQAKRKKGKK